MDKIKLELTVDEANLILEALGQQPYLKVADLIQKIQQQGANQLQNSKLDNESESISPEQVTAEQIVETAGSNRKNGN